jgi:hypothetical protein
MMCQQITETKAATYSQVISYSLVISKNSLVLQQKNIQSEYRTYTHKHTLRYGKKKKKLELRTIFSTLQRHIAILNRCSVHISVIL